MNAPAPRPTPTPAPNGDTYEAAAPAAQPRSAESVAAQILTELHTFVAKIDDKVEYKDLPTVMRKDGWIWQLREREVRPLANDMLMFTFDFWIGKSVEQLVLLDRVSTMLNAQHAGSAISLLARLSLDQTLIYLVTGRLPPPPAAAQPAPQAPPARGRVVPIADEDFELPEDEVEEAPAPVARPSRAAVDVLFDTEPDGVPLLVDPYELGEAKEDIIDGMLTLVEDTLPKLQTLEALQAFWTKNQKEFVFVSDFGTAADKQRLPSLFKARQTQLGTMMPQAEEPRRRGARRN